MGAHAWALNRAASGVTVPRGARLKCRAGRAYKCCARRA